LLTFVRLLQHEMGTSCLCPLEGYLSVSRMVGQPMGVLYDGWAGDATVFRLIFWLGWLLGAGDGGNGGFGGYGKWAGRVGAGIVFLGTCGYGSVGRYGRSWAALELPYAHHTSTKPTMSRWNWGGGKYRIDNTFNCRRFIVLLLYSRISLYKIYLLYIRIKTC